MHATIGHQTGFGPWIPGFVDDACSMLENKIANQLQLRLLNYGLNNRHLVASNLNVKFSVNSCPNIKVVGSEVYADGPLTVHFDHP